MTIPPDIKARNRRKLKTIWSCGVRPGCEHKTYIGAWLHGRTKQ